jgi:hypothetical protein
MDEKRLDGHKKTLGIIYIISACLSLLALLSLKAILEIVFAFAFEHASGEEERVMEFVSSITTIIGALLLIFAVIPELIAGIGLVTRQSWAMIFGLIVGGLNLFFFPIGTAIGVYAIWVYSEDQKIRKVPQPQ